MTFVPFLFRHAIENPRYGVDGDRQVKPARFLRCSECRRIEHGSRITFLWLLLSPLFPTKAASTPRYHPKTSFFPFSPFFLLIRPLFLSLRRRKSAKEEDDIHNDRHRFCDTIFVSIRRKEVQSNANCLEIFRHLLKN